jgi:hypothetical protein
MQTPLLRAAAARSQKHVPRRPRSRRKALNESPAEGVGKMMQRLKLYFFCSTF